MAFSSRLNINAITNLQIGDLVSRGTILYELLPKAVERGTRISAAKLLQRIRNKFGVYQPAIGPYPAWEELSEETQLDREKRGFSTDEPLLRTTELRDSYVVGLDGSDIVIGSDSGAALGHELGVPEKRIPARPVLGPAFLEAELDSFKALTRSVGYTITHGEVIQERSIEDINSGNIPDMDSSWDHDVEFGQ